MKDDAAAVEKQAEEIKARYTQDLQGVTRSSAGDPRSPMKRAASRRRPKIRRAGSRDDSNCRSAPRRRFDLSRPVLIGFAALLCVLVVLPLSWLVYLQLHRPERRASRSRISSRSFTDPTFLDPLITTFILATSSASICCAVAAPMGWLVARTDMPLRRTVRALVTASFVTPPFLGAIAWELLAAPNSGLLNQLYRAVTGAPADEHLFNIYSLAGLIFVISCYTFPYVFVLVANALDRMPGELEDASSILGGRAWATARRVTIPLALPALLAGALVAFLQAMTLFGSPAILALPAGFHTMTTKIWSLFQYPPKPELAAAASLPLLVLTVLLLRAEHVILGRRGYSVVGGKQRRAAAHPARRAGNGSALGVALLVLLIPGVPALRRAAQRRLLAGRVAARLTFDNCTLHNIHFVFFELSATKLALQNTFILGIAVRDHRHRAGAGHRLSHRAQGGAPAIACSASSPPRRSRSPASCSASACSSATRARRSCSTARCGSC